MAVATGGLVTSVCATLLNSIGLTQRRTRRCARASHLGQPGRESKTMILIVIVMIPILMIILIMHIPVMIEEPASPAAADSGRCGQPGYAS